MVTAVLLAMPTNAHAAACSIYNSGTAVPAGFGVPYNVLSAAKELLIQADCTSSSVNVTMGNGASNQYAYQFGYEWNGTQWNQFTLSGQKTGDWILGRGTGSFAIPSALSSAGYFVGYLCTWDGSAWKCGCRDTLCVQPFWQVQSYLPTFGGGSSGGGSSSGGSSGTIEVEAESGTLIGATKTTDSRASGGSAITLNNLGDSATISFSVPQAGTYQIWGQVIADDTAFDSVLVSMDGGAQDEWHFAQERSFGSSNYIWDQISYVGSGSRTNPQHNPMIYNLSAGNHSLRISYREPNTVIDKFIITSDLSFVPQGATGGGSSSGSTSGGTTSGGGSSSGGTTARDKFWEGKGYSLYWVGTPSDSDVGGNVENYFKNKWNGKYPLRGYSEDKSSGTVSIARAPDGSPSIKGVINNGDKDFILHVYGNQFGPKGPEADLVASMEWYNPCQGGQKPSGKSGTYVGFGHVWGSEDNERFIPGGSNNSNNSWSYRLALMTSNNFAGYGYFPGNTGPGQSFGANHKPNCGKWQILETEFVMNDVGQRNGALRIYIDGALKKEQNNFLYRTKPTVRPKGHGVLIKHNSGPPAGNETYYLRNWKLYVR